MKHYPSISKFYNGNIKLYTFDKCDGSCLRFEFSKKRGWYKFGTRNRLFDETDEIFGPAIPLFKETLSEPLAKIIVDNKWQDIVLFGEFWGKESFAGLHIKDDPKFITIFDASPHKVGLIPPQQFLKLFGEYGPNYLGQINWTAGFIDRVKNEEIEGITFEGVVGKVSENKKIIMYKAKTQKWIDKVKEKYDAETAENIIRS